MPIPTPMPRPTLADEGRSDEKVESGSPDATDEGAALDTLVAPPAMAEVDVLDGSADTGVEAIELVGPGEVVDEAAVGFTVRTLNDTEKTTPGVLVTAEVLVAVLKTDCEVVTALDGDGGLLEGKTLRLLL